MIGLECTCEPRNGPSRAVVLGYPRGEEGAHPEQRCPFTTLVLRQPTTCRCCPLCTLLCLPKKVISYDREFGDLYGGFARELGIQSRKGGKT